MFALLYWAAPNVKQPGFRWISPGGVLAVVIWLIASACSPSTSRFGSYNKTYGALAASSSSWSGCGSRTSRSCSAPNSMPRLQRQRLIEAGMPEDVEPFAEVRDTANR